MSGGKLGDLLRERGAPQSRETPGPPRAAAATPERRRSTSAARRRSSCDARRRDAAARRRPSSKASSVRRSRLERIARDLRNAALGCGASVEGTRSSCRATWRRASSRGSCARGAEEGRSIGNLPACRAVAYDASTRWRAWAEGPIAMWNITLLPGRVRREERRDVVVEEREARSRRGRARTRRGTCGRRRSPPRAAPRDSRGRRTRAKTALEIDEPVERDGRVGGQLLAEAEEARLATEVAARAAVEPAAVAPTAYAPGARPSTAFAIR